MTQPKLEPCPHKKRIEMNFIMRGWDVYCDKCQTKMFYPHIASERPQLDQALSIFFGRPRARREVIDG